MLQDFYQLRMTLVMSQTSIYGHGLMNLNAATAAVGSLQTINGNNLLDDPNTSYYDLVDNGFSLVLHFQMHLAALRPNNGSIT